MRQQADQCRELLQAPESRGHWAVRAGPWPHSHTSIHTLDIPGHGTHAALVPLNSSITQYPPSLPGIGG